MDGRYEPRTMDRRPPSDRVADGEWLVGAGEMADAIRSLDWSATPLGARDRWTESLRTVVNLLVACRFPMVLLWGRELLLICNDAYRVVAGGRHPAALGRSAREIRPEVWHVSEPIFAAVMERGETVYLEDACFPIDRHGFDEDAYFTLCYSPVRVEGGAVGGALVTLEETTARVAEREHAREALLESTALLQAISDTEDAVREAEERFRAAVEALPSGLIVADLTTRDLHWNREAFAIHGYDGTGDVHKFVESLIADHDLRTLGGDPIPVGRWPLPRLLAGESFRDCEVRVRNVRLGWERVFSYSAVVIPARGRTAPTGLLAIQDITERKRAEEALRDSEQRLRSVLENMSEGLMLFDAQGNLIYQNPASLRIHGYGPDSDGRIPRSDLPSTWKAWDPTGRPITFDEWPVSRVFRNERFQDQVLHVERVETGWTFDGSYNGSPIHDAHGRIAYGFITIRNITEERRAEAERARAEAALRVANEKLLEADRRKDEFLGMLSHELRNPLAPIRNSLYILDHAEANGQQGRRAKEIANRQLAHLTRLVDDLLDVTRIARGKIELRRTELDLAGLARRTAEDHRALMHDRRLELEVQVPDRPVIVDGDETRLAQVLGNLLHNAAKFTPGGGRVTLAVAADGDEASIHVRDTGAGIAPEVLPTIFEPFTQAQQTLARSEGGLGLGLALVKGLVAQHGGDVAAFSEGAGHGTEFVVTLPIWPRLASRSARPGTRP